MRSRREMLTGSLAALATFASCSSEERAEAAPEPAPQSEAPTEAARFDSDELKTRIDAGEDVYLLDVRTSEELEETGMIEGAAHIPIDELAARLSEVPKGRPVAIY